MERARVVGPHFGAFQDFALNLTSKATRTPYVHVPFGSTCPPQKEASPDQLGSTGFTTCTQGEVCRGNLLAGLDPLQLPRSDTCPECLVGYFSGQAALPRALGSQP